MKKNVIISVTGNQYVNEESDCIELVTEGTLEYDNNCCKITYAETEMTGMEGTTTSLEVEDERVTLVRTGATNSQLIFENDKKHVGYYETPYGNFSIGVLSNGMNIDIDENGGEIEIKYVLDVNNKAISKNDFNIKVREA